jgi:serine/threonine protein kinase
MELELYKKLNHKHIVGFTASHFDTKTWTLYIFLEYVPGGSISSMLERFGLFSEELTRNYTRQLLLGLEYLHGVRVVHRDLKGANILVSRDGIVKLTDFGASKAYRDATITDGMKSLRGSVFWMAPEVIKGTGYGRKADVWSLGCTVIEMLSGKHPWPDLDNHWSAMFQIAKTKDGPPRPTEISDTARDFLDKCLHPDPKERLNASELLHHPFVSGIEVARRQAEAARDLNHSL